MSHFCLSLPTRKPWPVLLSLAVALIGCATSAWAIGPNTMMANYSFEGLDYYDLPSGGAFVMATDPANAHTGVRSLQVKIQPTGSCTTKYRIFVWPHTAYTTTVWHQGHGSLQQQVLKHDSSLDDLRRA